MCSTQERRRGLVRSVAGVSAIRWSTLEGVALAGEPRSRAGGSRITSLGNYHFDVGTTMEMVANWLSSFGVAEDEELPGLV